MEKDHPGKIGQLNGKWAMLFKVAMSTYPLILAWGVWVTTEIYASREVRGQVVTKDGFKDFQVSVEKELLRSSLSDEWKSEIRAARVKLEAVSDRLTRIETLLQEHNK